MDTTRILQSLEKYDLGNEAQGRICIFSFDPKTCEIKKLIERRNLILYGGADILANVLAGNDDYAVKAMYLEFINGAAPGPISPPAYDRSGGIAYYNGLPVAPDGDVDFLRVTFAANPTISASGADYTGNQVTFFGISEGTTGVHGHTFGSALSSVYGAALVATPEVNDQTQDVVFSRVYSGIDRIDKETGFEIGVTWTIRFN